MVAESSGCTPRWPSEPTPQPCSGSRRRVARGGDRRSTSCTCAATAPAGLAASGRPHHHRAALAQEPGGVGRTGPASARIRVGCLGVDDQAVDHEGSDVQTPAHELAGHALGVDLHRVAGGLVVGRKALEQVRPAPNGLRPLLSGEPGHGHQGWCVCSRPARRPHRRVFHQRERGGDRRVLGPGPCPAHRAPQRHGGRSAGIRSNCIGGPGPPRGLANSRLSYHRALVHMASEPLDPVDEVVVERLLKLLRRPRRS